MSAQYKRLYVLFLIPLVLTFAIIAGCGKTAASSADTSGSTSEAVVSSMSGAVSGTSGEVSARAAELRVACPTMATNTLNTNCVNGTNQVTLTFPQTGCTYGAGAAFATYKPLWSAPAATTVGSVSAYGGTALTLTGATAGAFTCSSPFPGVLDVMNHTSVKRTFVGSTSVTDDSVGTATVRVNQSGSESLILDSTNLKGYSYTPTNGGYKRSFSARGTHSLSIGIHQIAYTKNVLNATAGAKVKWNHTVTTQDSAGVDHPLTIAIANGTIPGGSTTANLHTVTGTIYTQHNLAKSTATADLQNVVHVPSAGCCYPYGGKIVVSFKDGVNNGKTETLDFGSAGTACQITTYGNVQFTDVSGATSTKTLTHCL